LQDLVTPPPPPPDLLTPPPAVQPRQLVSAARRALARARNLSSRQLVSVSRRALARTRNLSSRQLRQLGAGATIFACGLLGYLLFSGSVAEKPAAPAGKVRQAVAAAPAPAPAPAPTAAREPQTRPAPPPALAPAPTRALAPAPAGCTATIESTPRAEVMLAGQSIGRTPLREAQVPCGESALSIVHPRYRPVNQTLTATPGSPASVVARLVRPRAQLQLASSPPGATFNVNGQQVGRGPLKLDVARYETVHIQASMPGKRVWRRSIYLRRPATEVDAQLTDAAGSSRPRR
jgi:hypothetical protein